MPRTPDEWRSDGLGRSIQVGLNGARHASPPEAVWSALSTALEPAPRRRPVGASLYAATALGVLLLFSVAVGGLTASLDPSGRGLGGAGYEHAAAYGLSIAELSIQPAVSRRPVDLTMPPGVAPWWRYGRLDALRRAVTRSQPSYEAYNRDVWLAMANRARHGTAAAPDGAHVR